MTKDLIPSEALEVLKTAYTSLKNSKTYEGIVITRDEVLERYQPLFSKEHIPDITEEEFRSFLIFENNKHWSGMHRHGPKMCADMKLLREALLLLSDESQLIEERIEKAISMVRGMGKAVATAILLVMYPDKYGVWNNTSEEGLKRLDLWPKFNRNSSFGENYAVVNKILFNLREKIDVDLWTLDAIWWALINKDIPEEEPILPDAQQRFGLESHLHEFLRDNWDKIELGNEWELYKEPGDDEKGFEYPTGIGNIDLLIKHKTEPRWMVIELKRNQTSDKTVGQILRYIGWVKAELAEAGEKVEGLIIAHQADDKILYALKAVDDVKLKLYEVEFHLIEPNTNKNSK